MSVLLAAAAQAIPAYPKFRDLRADDRFAIEAVVRAFPPYSDFGFGSLWAWNIDGTFAIAMLMDNLVVRFRGYDGGGHFYSFIGRDDVVQTAEELLDLSAREGLPARLRLVPRSVIEADDRLRERFVVSPDRDNDDYVYESDAWTHFLHPGFREHRRKVARCQERRPLTAHDLDLRDSGVQAELEALFVRWASQKSDSPDREHDEELTAMRRILAPAADGRLAARGFFAEDRLVAFSLWEGLPGDECAVIHFQKADRAYRGLPSWQAQDLGHRIVAAGIPFINYEQDLGIPGLREWKRSLQPCRYLRKYTIAPRGA